MTTLLQTIRSLFPATAKGRAQGVDLSHWDGAFDPTAAKQRIDFAILKLTEGTMYVDSELGNLWKGVQQVPIRGGYHYQRSGMSWLMQADHFLTVADQLDLHILALDVEELYNNVNDTFFADARRILDYIRSRAGNRVVMLYTNEDMYKRMYAAIVRIYPDGKAWMDAQLLWYAQYWYLWSPDKDPGLPSVRATWSIYQYTVQGTAEDWGTHAATDLDVFNGTPDEMAAWLGLTDLPPIDPEPPDPPAPRVEPVTETRLFDARVVVASRVNVRNYPAVETNTLTGLYASSSDRFSGNIWAGNDGWLWIKVQNSDRPELVGKWIAVRRLDGSNVLLRLSLPVAPLPTAPFRVRKWGDPVMVMEANCDTNQIGTSNFQAVGLYNKETGFGAVSNFLHIPHDDVLRLKALQVEDSYIDKVPDWRTQKMNWLCKFRGTIYMLDHSTDAWQTAPEIRWGTLKLGHNFVTVEDEETLLVKVPGEETARKRRMMKLAGFRKSDWDRPLSELVALGLVDRCYCAYHNNNLGDSPKGIVYSPFWSLLDWDFAGTARPQALYIPFEWLETV